MDYMRIYYVMFVCLLYWPQRAYLYYYPTVYWSPNNCRFKLNKPDQPRKYYFKIRPGSHLFFVCPHVALWEDLGMKSPHHGRMYENLMLVDKLGFDTCTVNKTRNPSLNREILRCDENPTEFKYTEEILSPHSALPNKMKYALGEHYYFISTSDGTLSSLDNTAAGHCTTHHMKLQIYLCRKDEPCEFEMPKCPFIDIFHQKTTPPATTITPTFNTTTAPLNTTVKQITTEESVVKHTLVEHERPTNQRTRELPSPNVDARKQNSSETLWGKDRKHIIIHITMSLVILILILFLIYIWISRRKPFLDSKKNKGIDSELFRQRPISMQTSTENEPFNGQTQTTHGPPFV